MTILIKTTKWNRKTQKTVTNKFSNSKLYYALF